MQQQPHPEARCTKASELLRAPPQLSAPPAVIKIWCKITNRAHPTALNVSVKKAFVLQSNLLQESFSKVLGLMSNQAFSMLIYICWLVRDMESLLSTHGPQFSKVCQKSCPLLPFYYNLPFCYKLYNGMKFVLILGWCLLALSGTFLEVGKVPFNYFNISNIWVFSAKRKCSWHKESEKEAGYRKPLK